MVGDTEESDLSEASLEIATIFNNAINSTNGSRKAATVSDLPKSELRCSVFWAEPVMLCKSVDGKYNCQVKYGFGLVLMGNDDLRIFEAVLYNHKQDILKRVNLQQPFSFNFLNVSLSDDEKDTCWSVGFRNSTHYNEFMKELEKRNVKTVATLKKTNDQEYYANAIVQLNEFALSWLEDVELPVSPKSPVISTDKPSEFSDYVESDSDCLSDIELPPLNQQPESKSPEVETNGTQDLLAEMALLAKVWTKNRKHNFKAYSNSTLISSKLKTLLQKNQLVDQTEITTLELLSDDLFEQFNLTLKDRGYLQQSLLEQKRSDDIPAYVIAKLQNEKIERLAKQLQSGDYYQPRKHQTFANEVALCSNLAEVNRLCKKYNCDDVALASICKALGAIFRSNDEEATNFADNLSETVGEWRRYVRINFKKDNGYPEGFISKSLPKHTRDTTNYLIRNFESLFKIDNKKPCDFKSDLDVSKLDD